MTDKQPTLRATLGIDSNFFTGFRRILLILCLVLVAIGTGLHFMGSQPAEKQANAPGNKPGLTGFSGGSSANPQGFNVLDNLLTNAFPGGNWPQPSTPAPAPPTASSPLPDSPSEWSPVFLKGGAGLFLGFCVGSAIRSFLKLGAVILGVYIVSLLMLSWMGWIEIRYPIIDAQLGNISGHFQTQFDSFKAFLSGTFPTMGAATAGFIGGIRKK